jgi:hypothetical protein
MVDGLNYLASIAALKMMYLIVSHGNSQHEVANGNKAYRRFFSKLCPSTIFCH